MGFFDWLNNTKEEEFVPEVCIERSSDFSNFKLVTDFIYEKSGITDLDKRALTASRLQQYAVSEDVYTTNEFLLAMKNSNAFYQEVINITTVNETFFLRELKELEWLTGYIKNSHKKFKILSMPCSSGEEIYSILLMLSKEGVSLDRVEIVGYDINSDAVEEAKNGKYNEHSLHKIDAATKEKYFTQREDSSYEISSILKNNTQFFQKNIFDLVDERAKFDIVLSRNMFIYFDKKKREEALQIIVNILKTEGIYIKGHADHIDVHTHLENIEYGIYRRK